MLCTVLLRALRRSHAGTPVSHNHGSSIGLHAKHVYRQIAAGAIAAAITQTCRRSDLNANFLGQGDEILMYPFSCDDGFPSG
jgi:hypothetical protein